MSDGNGNGKAPVIGFFRILDPMFFQVPGVFWNPAENFAGLRSGTFFRPKEDPGIKYAANPHCANYCKLIIDS